MRRLRYLPLLLFATAAVALVVMWQRSYTMADRLHGRLWGRDCLMVASKEGCVLLYGLEWHGADNWWTWGTHTYPVDDELSMPVGEVDQYTNRLGFGRLENALYFVMRPTRTMPDGSTIHFFGAATATLRGRGVLLPYWFLLLLTGAGAALGCWRWRFSLRGLLVGLAVAAFILVAIKITVGRV